MISSGSGVRQTARQPNRVEGDGATPSSLLLWQPSNPADPEVRALADRHYSRQTPGAARFVQAGRTYVLKAPGGRLEWVPTIRGGEIKKLEQIQVARAGWVTHYPYAEYVRHDWAGAWINQFFRNESDYLASDLIREAAAMTYLYSGWELPDLGMVTMIDPDQVRRSRTVGFTYRKAGFEEVGLTKTPPRKTVLQLSPDKIRKYAKTMSLL